MEQKIKKIYHNCKTGYAQGQITLEKDVQIKEAKPDILRVVWQRGKCSVKEKKVLKDKVLIRGILEVEILYEADEKNETYDCCKEEIPFEESFVLEGVREENEIQVQVEPEDISVSILHPGKINIRSLLWVEITSLCKEQISLVSEITEKNCQKQIARAEYSEEIYHKTKQFQIHGEIQLPSSKPNMEQVIWDYSTLRMVDWSLEGDKSILRAEVLMQIVYVTLRDQNLEWFETVFPIEWEQLKEDVVSMEGFMPELRLKDTKLELLQDEDGEERKLKVEHRFLVQFHYWKEQELEYVADAYSLDKQWKPDFREVELEKLVLRNKGRQKLIENVSLDMEQEEVWQVCVSCGKVVVDETTVKEEGLFVEGTLEVEILYLTKEKEHGLQEMKCYLPFQQMLDLADITTVSKTRLFQELEQLSVIVLDGRTMEIRATIENCLMVFETKTVKMISEITEEDLDMEEIQNAPGIVGIVLEEGENLFQIAREYHTSVEKLMEMNGLTSDSQKAGDKIIVVKLVEC